jgi:dTDP-L-rhamnose 4-epimerase
LDQHRWSYNNGTSRSTRDDATRAVWGGVRTPRFKTSMRILITGGTGFIGSHLSSALLRAGHDITTLSRTAQFSFPGAFDSGEQKGVRNIAGDAGDRDLIQQLVSDCDVIIHNAAAVGVAESALRMREFVQTNIIGMATISEVLRAGGHDVQKLMLGSSISVYGEGCYLCSNCGIVRPEIRVSMSQIEELKDWNPRCPQCAGHLESTATPETADRLGESVYAITKKAQEDLLLSTCRLIGIPAVVLRYCTVYGPGQSPSNPYSRIISSMFERHVPTISEDGKQSRDFIHVSDVVRANLLVLQSNTKRIETFNIGSGEQVELANFILLARQELEKLVDIGSIVPKISQTLVPGEIRHCDADCSKIEKALGFKHKVDLQTGSASLVKWLHEKYLSTVSK